MSELKLQILQLIEDNDTIRLRLFKLLRLLESVKTQPELEDILGIKVYLGEDYIEREVRIGDEIPNPFEDPTAGCNGMPSPTSVASYHLSVEGGVEVQDAGGNFIRVR
jgi:hypothetical protein